MNSRDDFIKGLKLALEGKQKALAAFIRQDEENGKYKAYGTIRYGIQVYDCERFFSEHETLEDAKKAVQDVADQYPDCAAYCAVLCE